jgi:hypothetical protein
MRQYPVVLELKKTDKGLEVRATTSIERALENAKWLEAELRCIELDYQVTLSAVKGALSWGNKGRFNDPRAFWFVGKYLGEFVGRLESHGFYLVGKNTTPAKHLGISKSSIEKMIAFYRRYADPFKIDVSVPWSRYRDNKESRACSVLCGKPR